MVAGIVPGTEKIAFSVSRHGIGYFIESVFEATMSNVNQQLIDFDVGVYASSSNTFFVGCTMDTTSGKAFQSTLGIWLMKFQDDIDKDNTPSTVYSLYFERTLTGDNL